MNRSAWTILNPSLALLLLGVVCFGQHPAPGRHPYSAKHQPRTMLGTSKAEDSDEGTKDVPAYYGDTPGSRAPPDSDHYRDNDVDVGDWRCG